MKGTSAARFLQSLRKNYRGGRPAKMHPCPYCTKEFSATDIRGHLPRCPKRKVK